MIIVFSRFWNPGFVEVALKTARHNCPDCRVVYLHDEGAKVNWPDSFNIEGQLAEAWSVACEAPETAYGPNGDIVRKASVLRWKLILDWMRDEGVSEVCACDSDVLLFENPFKSLHYQPGRIHVSHNKLSCVHAGNAIIPLEAIDAVWAHLLGRIRNVEPECNTLSDMGSWSEIAFQRGYVDQNTIIDGVAWDHHMGWLGDNEWEDDGTGYKHIQWIDQKPHCLHIPSGKLVRLVNLHCWEGVEPNMPEYARMGGVTCDNS